MKQRGKKELKEVRTTSEASETMLNTPTFKSKESQRKKTKRKAMKNILEEIRVENFPKMGKEIATQVQKIEESPKQEKSKVKHPKTILIKLMKIKHKEQILTAAKEKQQTHKGIP